MLCAHEFVNLLEKFPFSFWVGTVTTFIFLVFNGLVFLTHFLIFPITSLRLKSLYPLECNFTCNI